MSHSFPKVIPVISWASQPGFVKVISMNLDSHCFFFLLPNILQLTPWPTNLLVLKKVFAFEPVAGCAGPTTELPLPLNGQGVSSVFLQDRRVSHVIRVACWLSVALAATTPPASTQSPWPPAFQDCQQSACMAVPCIYVSEYQAYSFYSSSWNFCFLISVLLSAS